MVGFDELKNKAADALHDEKTSDSLLDKAADFANDKTDGKQADKIRKGRDFLDSKLGDDK